MFLFVETTTVYFVRNVTDIQVLSFEVPCCVQEEEESQKSQMDQSLQKDRWQRIGSGSVVRIRKEEEHTCQIQQRIMEQDDRGNEEDRND